MTKVLHTYHLSLSDDDAERDDLRADIRKARRHSEVCELRNKSYGLWDMRTSLGSAELREVLPAEFMIAHVQSTSS